MNSHRLSATLLGLLLTLGVVSCGNIKTSHVPGGATLITCTNGMKECVGRAAKLCGDDGYTIIEGVSRPKLLGGSSSSYRSMSEIAQLQIVCGIVEKEEDEGTYQLPERTDEPIESDAPDASTPLERPQVCTPGATQRCVGPGACDGGQVCTGDGSGFGACDCGSSTSDAEGSPSESSSDRSDSSGGKGPSSLDPGGEKSNPPKVPAPAKMPAPTPL